MKLFGIVVLLGFALLFSACSSVGQNESTLYWTKAEVDAVQDLSQLGELTYNSAGNMVIEGKIVKPEFIMTQFYGKEHDFLTIEEAKALAEAKGLKVEDLSPSELEDLQIESMITYDTPSADSEPISTLQTFNINSSYSDVYKSSCSNSIKAMRNRAATQASSSAYYLAADSSLYKGGSLLDKKYKDSYGPISGVVALASADYASTSCHIYTSFSGKGWHKGKQTSTSSPIYKNTSDSGNF